MIMSDGTEVPHRTVLGVRTHFSLNGGAHRIEALLWIAPWRVYEVRTQHSFGMQSRSYGWEVWHTVYVGLDREAADAADDRVQKLLESAGALTE